MATTDKLREKATNSHQAIRIFLAVSFLLDAVSLVRLLGAHALFAKGRPFGLLFQYAPDWLNYAPQAARFHRPDFFHPPGMTEIFTYPAPASILYFLLQSTHQPIAVMKLTIVLTAIVLAVVIFSIYHRYCRKHADQGLLLIVAVVVLSYPLAMEYRQTNIEIYLFLLLAGGLVQFLRRRDLSAAALIGVVASIKYYPLAFLGLFLVRKKWRAVFVGLAVFVTTTVASLWLATGSVAASWAGTARGMKFFADEYMSVYRPDETPYDHSLFALIKTVWRPHFSLLDGQAYLHAYMLAISVMGTLLFFTRIRKLPVINQLFCLTIAICLFPPVSYDYTLLHLYVPMLLLLIAVLRGSFISAAQSASMALLAVVFSWQVPSIEETFGGGQIKAVALLVLFVIALIWPLSAADRWGDEDQELASPA